MVAGETIGHALVVGAAAEAEEGLAETAVPGGNVVVRGGQGEMPAAGTIFSEAHGSTLEDAAQGVPHGTIRQSTAGEIRRAGGSVKSRPELTKRGKHESQARKCC